jgi:hypothetical protein
MMDSSPLLAHKSLTTTSQKGRLIGDLRFDRLIAVFICWYLGGLFLDAWEHSHGLVDNTFFTPWHAVLYSGYAACALVLILSVLVNRRRGYSWRESIPRGYEFSVWGVLLFAVAGVGDLIWHTLFGFEVGIEPLLSPTHLLLALVRCRS